MTVTYIGSLTVGETIPGAAGAIDSALPDLQLRMGALASFEPTVGDLSSSLALAGQILSGVQAAISLGISLPDPSAQFAVVAEQVADLQASLNVALAFSNALQAAGVHAYRYSGAADALGSDFSAELAGGLPGGAPSDSVEGILLATSVPAAWSALASIFQVTPP